MPRFSIQAAIPVLLFLVIGCMLAYFGIVQAINSQAKQTWPQVDAVVLESEAIFTGSQGEGGGEAEIKMLVEYRVQQNTYQALIYAQDVLKADSIPPRYAVGKKVTIYYDPAEPSEPIHQLPSVMSSVFVVIISLIPIIVAMPFIIFWIAMGFAHWKISQARRFLRQGVQDAGQFNQYLEQLQAEGRTVTLELLAKKMQLVRQVEEAHTLLIGLQDEIDDLTPPLEEQKDSPPVQVVINSEVKHTPQTLFQRIVSIVVLTGSPLLLGFVMTWWAPYYLMTFQRNVDNSVDCKLQQMLFGFLPYGESETVAGLREIDYEMEGKIRKQRSLMRLTGTSTKKIYAGRAAFTTKSIKQFLLNIDSRSLLLSDGHTMLGLYFPYVLVILSLAAITITNKDLPLPDRVVSFTIGSLLASGIALLPFLYLCDIHNTRLITWLILAAAFLCGGIINVIRQLNVF